MLADADTVAADHTARGIDGMRLIVDTRGLAVLGTERAVLALLHIEVNLQEREAAEEGEYRAHRTDGVAVGSSVAPSQYSESNERYSGNNE